MPNSITYLNRTPIVSGMWLGVAPRTDTKCVCLGIVFKREWPTCSKYDNHSKFNSQHNWEDLHDHLMSTRIFTLIINKIFM
jgi:hypothetical protein